MTTLSALKIFNETAFFVSDAASRLCIALAIIAAAIHPFAGAAYYEMQEVSDYNWKITFTCLALAIFSIACYLVLKRKGYAVLIHAFAAIALSIKAESAPFIYFSYVFITAAPHIGGFIELKLAPSNVE